MNKGFTLLEIIVAIFVMTIGIVGIYALVPKVISVGIANIDKFIVSQLAREGVELIRNIRDRNWLQGSSWDAGLTGCSGGCEIDYNDLSLEPWQDRYLKIDSNGFYNYATGTDTKFKRKITITSLAVILNVKVELTWPGEDSPLVVEENVYNWR